MSVSSQNWRAMRHNWTSSLHSVTLKKYNATSKNLMLFTQSSKKPQKRSKVSIWKRMPSTGRGHSIHYGHSLLKPSTLIATCSRLSQTLKKRTSKCEQGRIYREEGMQLTMYHTYSSDFVSETGCAKNRIQYTDVSKWAVLFTEL